MTNANKNNLTELVFILDASGSMAGLEEDTIGGFNAMIVKQKKQEGACVVSTIRFSNISVVLHDRVALEAVSPLTEEQYYVGGCTALLDAVGGAIQHVRNIHKYARPEDVPTHTLFVITTDGMENASHRYTAERVKEMIEQQKEECGWEFLFIGANIDAIAVAKQYGIDEKNAVNYNADGEGTKIVYSAVADAVCCVRDCGGIQPIWSKEIDADYQRRGKGKKK